MKRDVKDSVKAGTGSKVMDKFLKGGYDSDIITCIYGPAGSGKTNLMMLAMTAVKNKKIIYIDTEGNFSASRLKQIAREKYNDIMKNILLFKPYTFEDQRGLFEKIRNIVNEDVGLIILDSATMLYRVEFANTDDIQSLNREFGGHMSNLAKIAGEFEIPVLITSQVYSDFENEGGVRLVGGNILKYASKCLLELKKKKGPFRVAVLVKHRSLPEKEKIFKITESGLEDVETKDSYKDKNL